MIQTKITLPSKPRGFHLVTDEIVRQLNLSRVKVGMLNLFLQHCSASLSINENADSTVRDDMESWIQKNIRDNEPYYRHNYEGDDDMPAHIKSSLFGVSLNIPITDGKLSFGTWQGIYLCEHRTHGGSRSIIATVMGE